MSGPSRAERAVLLTGATGFVGRHLHPALLELGARVSCCSRRVEAARRRSPEARWVAVDLESGEGLREAMEGCGSAVYLYHAMAGGSGYTDRERIAAERFRDAASEAGLDRIVYLGGVAPSVRPSPHLASRLETGRILREGDVPTVELRAAMVIGEGSTSWQIVKDLAARLPAMALPTWLGNLSMPILIDDLVVALVGALTMEIDGSTVYDAPGAQSISHKELLRRVARELGHDPPMVEVPFQVPLLSSLWVGLFSDADFAVVKELVGGLRSDLLPSETTIWTRLDGFQPASVDRAIEIALRDALRGAQPDETKRARIAERVRELWPG